MARVRICSTTANLDPQHNRSDLQFPLTNRRVPAYAASQSPVGLQNPFPGAGMRFRILTSWVIVCGISGFCLQQTLAGTKSFSATLDGGSKGVASNLTGTLNVSQNGLLFEAFPQVDYIAWRCEQVTDLQQRRGHEGREISFTSTGASYRFSMDSSKRAEEFVNAATEACRLPR